MNKIKLKNEFLLNLFTIAVLEIFVLLLFVIQFRLWNKNFSVPYFTFGDDFWRNSVLSNIIHKSKWYISYNTQFPFGRIDVIPEEGYFNFFIQILSAKILNNIGYVSWFFTYFTYFITALLTFYSLRILKICRISSIVGALLFDFVPYHFYRIGHLNLLPFYTLPVLLSACLLLSKYTIVNMAFSKLSKNEKKWLIFSFINALILGMTSIYYLLFVAFCIIYPFVLGILNRNKTSIISSVLIVLLMSLGMVICVIYGNYLFIYAEKQVSVKLQKVSNPNFYSAGSRTLWDIVAYQLPVVDLFLPIKSFISKIDLIAKSIHSDNVIALEDNYMSTLGLPLSFSVLLSIFYLFKNNKNEKQSQILSLCAKYNLFIIFFATTLGFSLFLGLLTTGIRSFNRFSIFIAFFSVAFLCSFVDLYFISNKKRYYLILSVILVSGLLTEISFKDGKYLGMSVYEGYSYCDEYTEADARYKECKSIADFLDDRDNQARVAFWDNANGNILYITSLSKDSFFNYPCSASEIELFWKKQNGLILGERIRNLCYLGYNYIVISDSCQSYEEDSTSFTVLFGDPIKTTNHMRIFLINNSENISLDVAKERFYELYNKQ